VRTEASFAFGTPVRHRDHTIFLTQTWDCSGASKSSMRQAVTGEWQSAPPMGFVVVERRAVPAVVDAEALRGRGPRPGVEGAQRRRVRRRLVVAQAGEAVAEAAPAEPCARCSWT
jgi:hypothetical protein